MRKNLLLLLLLVVVCSAFSQETTFSPITNLSVTISESSGLLNVNGQIITHNDSGKEPKLYQLDTLTGAVIRTIIVNNIKNTDWEDLTQDQTFIYIADIGNNAGTRKDLKIYRILKADFLNNSKEQVSADSIMFAYSDQQVFTSNLYNTNFDAEALVARGDSLYIFTKNWNNRKTYIYSIPKYPGSYSSHKIDSLSVDGFVTGATYSESRNEILLTGYTFTESFIWTISNLTTHQPSSGKHSRYTVAGSPVQIEGICERNGKGFFISSEAGQGNQANLYGLQIPALLNTLSFYKDPEILLFPNPASDEVFISNVPNFKVQLINADGTHLGNFYNSPINIRGLSSGIYTLIFTGEGARKFTKTFVVH